MNLNFVTLVLAVLTSSTVFCAEGEPVQNQAVSPEKEWNVFAFRQIAENDGRVDFLEGKIHCFIPVIENQKGVWFQISRKMELSAGKTYLVKLTVKSDKKGKLPINYQMADKPWTVYAGTMLDLAVGEKSYEFKLTPKASRDGYNSPRILNFLLGSFGGATLIFSKISVE